jgi:6,7-dimethyl-8-ribityllumazine synthase
VLIVVSRFNQTITQKLLDGALLAFAQHGCNRDSIDIVWVPGAFEIPGVIGRLYQRYDAVIALGAVIRGQTPHFDYVAGAVTQGVQHWAQQGRIPVIFGVLTTDTVEQAEERAGGKAGNKGHEAALTALEMMSLYARLDHQ